MIADMHAHLGFGHDEVVSDPMDQGLVDVTAISSIVGGAFPTEDELRAANDMTFEWMRRYPGRGSEGTRPGRGSEGANRAAVSPGTWPGRGSEGARTGLVVGFTYTNARLGETGLQELERCLQGGMRGVKLWIATLADDPRVNPLMEIAQAANAPVLAHAWVKTTGNLPFESRPEHVAALARRFPKVRFILAHFGGEWETGAKAARDCPNLYVDTSGSLAEMDMTEYLVRKVGIERVLFGTDGTNLHYCLGKIAGARLSDDDKDRILWRNAAELLGLGAG